MIISHDMQERDVAALNAKAPEAAEAMSGIQPTRVDFRHASGHLKEKRPGYYLILLRNEIRHRSLRDKPALNV